jgi:hypothetical protein
MPVMPPTLSVNPIFRRTLRFQVNDEATDDTVYDITRGDIYFLMVSPSWVDDDFTGAFSLFNAIRVRKVSVWGLSAPARTSGISVIALSFQGKNAPDSLLDAVGTPFRVPYLNGIPPSTSLAYQWTNAASTLTEGLFGLSLSIGDVVDLDVEFTLLDGVEEEAAVPNASWSDETPSGVYYSSLNNSVNTFIEAQGVVASGI